jgi:hypothetical protein
MIPNSRHFAPNIYTSNVHHYSADTIKLPPSLYKSESSCCLRLQFGFPKGFLSFIANSRVARYYMDKLMKDAIPVLTFSNPHYCTVFS